jgi:class 3 adenylate cyclase
MNETARIEGVAHGGALLASKHLVERLAGPAAADLGIDPDAVAYTTVAELAPDDAKAIRDAGTIAIARL